MLVNGYVTDWLVKGGRLRLKAVRSALLPGCSVLPPYAGRTASDNIHDGGSADWHGLFCIHFAGTSCWGLIHVAVVLA